ncbi:MAG: glycosyltransferase family 2 protein [Planctomycetes bacterium]|nr:glycosyltransferase family 2 protein [Planctomycetota bacterium]
MTAPAAPESAAERNLPRGAPAAGHEHAPLLSIVIPAYNEGSRIAETIDAAAAFVTGTVPHSEVIVVDDGSTDDTAAIAAARSETFPCVLRVLREPHRGKGAAVKSGMLAARGRRRMLCDADLAMSFAELPRFLTAAEAGADVVIGSRQAAGAVRLNESAARHLLGRCFNLLVRAFVIGGIADTQCGYKLFSDRAAAAIFPLLAIEGFAFDVEALYVARRFGFRIVEIPITWHAVAASKVRPARQAGAMLAQILRIPLRSILGRYPR